MDFLNERSYFSKGNRKGPGFIKFQNNRLQADPMLKKNRNFPKQVSIANFFG